MAYDRFVLLELPRHRRPRRFLTDVRRFLGAEPTTPDLARAKIWADRTGPLQCLRRNPQLRGKFIPLALSSAADAPEAGSRSTLKRAG